MVCGLVFVALTGCVDSNKRFDEFLDRAGAGGGATPELDAAGPPDAPVIAGDASPPADGMPAADGPTPSNVPDISGMFYIAAAAVINPDTPLEFLSRTRLTPNPDGRTAELEISVHPLRVADRMPSELASEIVRTTTVSADLTFEVDFGVIMFPGETNPITGGDITASIIMQGRILSRDFVCGPVDGQVMMPTMFDLDGSTFAAQRIAPGTVGAALPPPIAACP